MFSCSNFQFAWTQSARPSQTLLVASCLPSSLVGILWICTFLKSQSLDLQVRSQVKANREILCSFWQWLTSYCYWFSFQLWTLKFLGLELNSMICLDIISLNLILSIKCKKRAFISINLILSCLAFLHCLRNWLNSLIKTTIFYWEFDSHYNHSTSKPEIK